MSVCVHGNLCREIYKRTGYIHSCTCPKNCKYFEELSQKHKAASDTLTVTFDSSIDDYAGICVSRVVDGKIVILKAELGEQADILYHLLTEQTLKAEIKEEEK